MKKKKGIGFRTILAQLENLPSLTVLELYRIGYLRSET